MNRATTLRRHPLGEPTRQGDGVLAAVATTDPFDRRTFSGYSAALFGELQSKGLTVHPVTSKQVRARDVLHGALYLRGILRGQVRGRRAPLLDPDWCWSPEVLDRLSARVNRRLSALGTVRRALQIGTHVLLDQRSVSAYCLTDCTVIQAVEAGEFAISRASQRTVDRAIEWQREVFDSCERVFTTSRWAAASVIADYGQASARVQVVGAGANVATIAPPARVLGPPTVLFVGYDWDLKGGPLLLDAWRMVRQVLPTARLVIVGCRPPMTDPGIEVVGRLDPRDAADRRRLVDAYASASCLALLSDFDAFPNVVIEAGAMGVPVLAFDEQSRCEVVQDGSTGLLVRERSAEAVASAMYSLLADLPFARAMGARAREAIRGSLTWDHVADQVLAGMGCA
jgi:glycosyltransferase involved in cell wall biosynthesis